VKPKPVAMDDRLGPGPDCCDHLSQPHAGLFEEPVCPAPETKETCVEGRHMSRRPASGSDGTASPVDTLNSAEYLRLLHLRICLPDGVPFDQQSNPLALPANTHNSVHNDSAAGGAVEDDVVNVYRGVADRTHIQDIAIPHQWIHARTSSAKAHSVSGSQELRGELLELPPFTRHRVAT